MNTSWTAYRLNLFIAVIGFFFLVSTRVAEADSLIIDHTCTSITQIPQSAIEHAKEVLHIAYGHTSHGSQLTDGMTGLVDFANDGGLGLSLPEDIFQWNNGGIGGALDLHDYAMDGDAGYYPDWVNNTRAYLGIPDRVSGKGRTHPNTNVVIWSWCGQVDEKYAAGTLHREYLTPMTQLEADYPGVAFVYMTGHVDIWDDANNKAANQTIRDFCNANDKILYDFADIESHDPDGEFFRYVNDNCDYYSSADSGRLLGNWAKEWQRSHAKRVDWYDCSSAHSEPLNANLKAYAAWWLWARLAGWDPSASGDIDDDGDGYTTAQGDCNDSEASVYPGAIEICGDGIDQDCDGGDLACVDAPSAPTGVNASDGTIAGMVKVSWNASTGAASYDVYRAHMPAWTGTPPRRIASSIATLFYDDATAVSGNRYCYWVKARNSWGVSRYGKFDTGFIGSSSSVLPAPTSVSASDGTNSEKITITWNAVPGSALYEVWRATMLVSKGGKPVRIGLPSQTAFNDTTGIPGTIYYYWVKSRDSWGSSKYSISDTGYCRSSR